MRRILLSLLLCLPLSMAAQNTWEMPEQVQDGKIVKVLPDQKYLVGAVPVVDGRVVFDTVINVPGKNARQIHDILLDYMTKITKEKNQLEQSRITLDDKNERIICGTYQEWLVFKSTALVLDRTRFIYNIIAKYEDGKAEITLTRIYYLYDEERTPQSYKAEEWITDEYGLKKKKNALSRVSGKFRKKTIDRKDYLFRKFAEVLK
ncbi:DUF4468 domain-containing protein [Xylanibacter muris]|uniref:DUF4468 domain-containing protein n=1 Tax=Xylanibacter muris TaxID=2736290 RepID=A0ABX2ALZ1_9BACT|nr:DUF4468 domain-containing protein [Xylanibacter muris]NPD91244.1 DUF4468 domain-containing protein [Xylanibacter muris]